MGLTVPWAPIGYNRFLFGGVMNIFMLDECPIQSAKFMSNEHVIKMILETAQLLSTAHWTLSGYCGAYKATHVNHPSSIWARQSSANYEWLYKHLVALIDEHQYRYPNSKLHKTAGHLETLKELPRGITIKEQTPIIPAMPDEFKALYEGVEAYRMYYSIFKRHDKNGKPYTWTKRQKPSWYL